MPLWNVLGPLFLTPWYDNITTIIKKAQQRIFFLWQLELYLSSPILVQFWRAVTESILTSSITVWLFFFQDKALVKSLAATYHQSKSFTPWELLIMLRRSSHICHILHISFLPSGRWLKAICTGTARHHIFSSAFSLRLDISSMGSWTKITALLGTDLAWWPNLTFSHIHWK